MTAKSRPVRSRLLNNGVLQHQGEGERAAPLLHENHEPTTRAEWTARERPMAVPAEPQRPWPGHERVPLGQCVLPDRLN